MLTSDWTHQELNFNAVGKVLIPVLNVAFSWDVRKVLASSFRQGGPKFIRGSESTSGTRFFLTLKQERPVAMRIGCSKMREIAKISF
jgi:hypothetical protein